MKGTLPGCLDPTPVQPWDSSLLRLLGCLEDKMRELGRNKVGIDFLSFLLTSSLLYVGVQSICHPVLVVSYSRLIQVWRLQGAYLAFFGFFAIELIAEGRATR